jgi:ATP-binding cassette subfamily F protein 3
MAVQTFTNTLLSFVEIIVQRPSAWKYEGDRIEWPLRYNPPSDPMALIQAQQVAKSYGAQDIFAGVELSIPHQARIALVGLNGVGKTTLLDILAGNEQPDQGFVRRARNLRFGFLPQESMPSQQSALDDVSPWAYCLQAFDHLRKQEIELSNLELRMADPRNAEQAIARYGDLQEQFENAGGYTYPAYIRRVLNGLGIHHAIQHRPMSTLSGGERTRVELARLLLEDPDLLILDEPTNHLDMLAVEWLEAWLRDWPGAALIVSHDRYFLDRTVDTIWELSNAGIDRYRGNYSSYRQQRLERRETQIKQHRMNQEFIRREKDYIQRNIAGQNTKQAQGRRTRLERFLVDNNPDLPGVEDSPNLAFGAVERSGDIVIEAEDLKIGYQDSEPLFEIQALLLNRGDCAAVIGPNGTGKTSLLKTIIGELPPLSGRLRLGASLKTAVFDQAQADLDPNARVIDEIIALRPDLGEQEVRSILGRYKFRGDEVFKLVGILSGGERSRLAIAKIILQEANLLLLDEPTSHLDLQSQEQLEEALSDFPGSIVFVSHDRFLVQSIASQIWQVDPEEKRLDVFRGGYQEYLASRVKPIQRKEKKRTSTPSKAKSTSARITIEEVEQQITFLEREMASIAGRLGNVEGDYQEAQLLSEQYAALEVQLESQMALWSELAQGHSQA